MINIGKVANRVQRGGHDVPTKRIVERYVRCLRLLPDAIGAADEVKRCGRPTFIDPLDLPTWWTCTLFQIKPAAPLIDGTPR